MSRCQRARLTRSWIGPARPALPPLWPWARAAHALGVMPTQVMVIDYFAQSEKYRPEVIETLLVGEAPPPNGTRYFYLPARLRRAKSIRDNRSLPATIFHHYFSELPDDEEQYANFLLRLKKQRVFFGSVSCRAGGRRSVVRWFTRGRS